MAARFDQDGELEQLHEINMTPFIDVMLVLLIIFMVAAPLATVDIAVDLPAATAQPQPRPDRPLFLSLRADLSLHLGEAVVAREALAAALDAASAGDHEARIFLRADRSVSYGEVVAVMNGLRDAGYLKVALVGPEDLDDPRETMTSSTATLEPGPRWGAALLVVLGAHAAMLTVLLRTPAPPPSAMAPAAIMIDLPAAPPAPPLPAAEPVIDLPIPDMPQPVAIEVPLVDLPVPDMPAAAVIEVAEVELPVPDMPAPAVVQVAEVELPVPDMPAAVVIEVAQVDIPLPEELPPPVFDLPDQVDPVPAKPAPAPPRAKPRPPRPEPQRTQIRAEAKPVAPPPAQATPRAAQSPAAQPTAPIRALPQSVAAAMPNWQGALLAHLERHKRYPSSARNRRQEGTTTIRFTVDRDGNVDRVALLVSSGHAALDAETLALMERASPLPPPPPEAGTGPLRIAVPVEYRLR